MFNSFDAHYNVINDYLSDRWTESPSEIYRFVDDKWQALANRFSLGKLTAAVECLCLHTLSEEAAEWQEAAKKLTKADLLEINTTLGFLAGIAYAELQRQ